MAVWVVLPTYNEAENLERVVVTLLAVLGEIEAHGHRVLVVDDNSPDGTGLVADRLADRYAGVDVLHRADKRGLGPAYAAGFDRALAGDATRVVQMDADFSHDARDLPRLLAALDAGADVALGSRYVRGGGIEGDWGLVRRLLSRAGCLYAQRLLGVRIRDLTGGFKAWRPSALRATDYASMRADGYGFQVELTHRALLAGQRVVEVPIVFHDRAGGSSKMTPRIALEAALLVPRLRRRYPK